MLIVACGDSFTQGEGLDSQDQVYAHILARKFNATIKNLAQSGASEYLILNQVEEAVKLKPDLIIIGHTSEYRWKVWDFRRNMWQGFIVANHVVENEKYLQEIKEYQGSKIFISAHIGNWEITRNYLLNLGFKLHSVYRHANNHKIDQLGCIRTKSHTDPTLLYKKIFLAQHLYFCD